MLRLLPPPPLRVSLRVTRRESQINDCGSALAFKHTRLHLNGRGVGVRLVQPIFAKFAVLQNAVMLPTSSPLRLLPPMSPIFLHALSLAALFIACSCQDHNGAKLLYLPQASFTLSSAYTSSAAPSGLLNDPRLESAISWSPRADDPDPSVIVDMQRLYADPFPRCIYVTSCACTRCTACR